jgi:hypothetical protein
VVKDALLSANRAVALRDAIDDGFDFEADGAAMTTAKVVGHFDGS